MVNFTFMQPDKKILIIAISIRSSPTPSKMIRQYIYLKFSKWYILTVLYLNSVIVILFSWSEFYLAEMFSFKATDYK